MLVGNNSSCFLDACELAFGLSAHMVAARMKSVTPDCPFDEVGYPATLVTAACLEMYGIGLAKVDPVPTMFDDKGEHNKVPGTDHYVEHVSKWFGRPGFRCVIQGPRASNGLEHANAWNGQFWLDPSQPDHPMEGPNVNIRSMWLFTLPTEGEGQPQPEAEVVSDD